MSTVLSRASSESINIVVNESEIEKFDKVSVTSPTSSTCDSQFNQSNLGDQSTGVHLTAMETPDETNVKPVYSYFEEKIKLSLPESFSHKVMSVMQLSSSKTGDDEPTKYFTTNIEDAVKIEVKNGDFYPVTIPVMFKNACEQWGNRVALAYRGEHDWNWITYKTYYKEVELMAKTFIALGLTSGEGIGIACANSKNYFVAALGAVFAGGFFVGLPGLGNHHQKSILQNVMKECKVNIVVADRYNFKDSIDQIAQSANVPTLKAIIDLCDQSAFAPPKKSTQVDSKIEFTKKMTYTAKDLFVLSKFIKDEAFCKKLETIVPNKCCAVFYPSITDSSGPLGIMCSHDNLTYMAKHFGSRLIEEYCSLRKDLHDFRIVSHLKLNHPFSLVLEMIVPWTQGGLTAFPRIRTNGQSFLMQTVYEVNPTLFCASTNLWDDLVKWITEKTSLMGRIKRELLLWSRRKSLFSFYEFTLNKSQRVRKTGKLDQFIIKRVKKSIGFGCCDIYLSFDGAIKRPTLEYFLSFNIPICQTLTTPCMSGPHLMGTYAKYQIGAVEEKIPFIQTKLVGQKQNTGKVHCAGRHICMGIIYPVNLPFFFSRFPFINTGLIALKKVEDSSQNSHFYVGSESGGDQNKYHEKVEKIFKESSPIISYCMVVGHTKPFFSIFVTIKTEIDPVTLKPTDVLTRTLQKWLSQRGETFTKLSDLRAKKSDVINKALDDALSATNKNIKRKLLKLICWRILPKDFTIVEGEVDPITMKIHREEICRKNKHILNEIYADSESDSE